MITFKMMEAIMTTKMTVCDNDTLSQAPMNA